jgi:organic hydroperoxide reductase OsmC/OhrA
MKRETMQDFPHFYPVTATAGSTSAVTLSTPGTHSLESQGPVEFGGPGDLWSPETLLVAAVADCLILSFRGTARAARFEWLSLDVDATGKLDRVDRVTRFVHFEIRATLKVPAGTNLEKAEKLLHTAERHCLITNSLLADSSLDTRILAFEE